MSVIHPKLKNQIRVRRPEQNGAVFASGYQLVQDACTIFLRFFIRESRVKGCFCRSARDNGAEV